MKCVEIIHCRENTWPGLVFYARIIEDWITQAEIGNMFSCTVIAWKLHLWCHGRGSGAWTLCLLCAWPIISQGRKSLNIGRLQILSFCGHIPWLTWSLKLKICQRPMSSDYYPWLIIVVRNVTSEIFVHARHICIVAKTCLVLSMFSMFRVIVAVHLG